MLQNGNPSNRKNRISVPEDQEEQGKDGSGGVRREVMLFDPRELSATGWV